MSEPFDREAHEAEMREFHWREAQVQRELTEALRHYLRVLCPDEDLDRHAAWLSLLAERTVSCLTSFYGGSHPWYDFVSAPEALKLALYGRSDLCQPGIGWTFRRLTIEHEPSCAGYRIIDYPDGTWTQLMYCQCDLRVRRDAP